MTLVAVKQVMVWVKLVMKISTVVLYSRIWPLFGCSPSKVKIND